MRDSHPLFFVSFVWRTERYIAYANNNNRARYVAVSNTVIGIAILLGGLIGIIADMSDVQRVILLLSAVAQAAGVYISRLPDVSN